MKAFWILGCVALALLLGIFASIRIRYEHFEYTGTCEGGLPASATISANLASSDPPIYANPYLLVIEPEEGSTELTLDEPRLGFTGSDRPLRIGRLEKRSILSDPSSRDFIYTVSLPEIPHRPLTVAIDGVADGASEKATLACQFTPVHRIHTQNLLRVYLSN